jgi:hypothetical protein
LVFVQASLSRAIGNPEIYPFLSVTLTQPPRQPGWEQLDFPVPAQVGQASLRVREPRLRPKPLQAGQVAFPVPWQRGHLHHRPASPVWACFSRLALAYSSSISFQLFSSIGMPLTPDYVKLFGEPELKYPL